MTGTSEATIRRDISALHVQGRLRRVRGGAEALHPPQFVGIAGRPFKVSETVNIEKKRAIARAAVELCADGDSIIMNAGTTTFQMVHFLARPPAAGDDELLSDRRAPDQAFAQHRHGAGRRHLSRAGRHPQPLRERRDEEFLRHRMFMGAQGVGRLGVMERDPLMVQGERKLIEQAEELVVLVDSSKFAQRSSLIVCGLDRVDTIITDDGISDEARRMVEDAGITLLVTAPEVAAEREESPLVA